jgi:hypothetical protein
LRCHAAVDDSEVGGNELGGFGPEHPSVPDDEVGLVVSE